MSQKQRPRQQSERKLSLSKIIGNTSLHNSCFSACSPAADEKYVAYAAGAMVVVYNAASNKQVKFFQAEQGVSAIAFSADGRYIAAGERGKHPLVHVWETKTGVLRHKLKVHAFGVSCIQFSPDNARIVTVGYKHDGKLCLWSMASGSMLASSKVQNQIYAMSYSQDGSYFVTAGDRHLKYWYPVTAPDGSVQLDGRPASILGEHQSATFLDVVCGRTKNESAVYTTTSTGLLCTFSAARLMERWVQLDAQYAYSVALTRGAVAIGCDNGIARLFEPESLAYICTVPHPMPLYSTDFEQFYAATTGLRFLGDDLLICLYADRSTVVWDIHDPHIVSKKRASVAHRDCIWDVQFISTAARPELPDVDETMDEEANTPLPEGTFVTCAADGTVRMWNTNPLRRRNVKRSMWSSDMLQMLDTMDASNRRLQRNNTDSDAMSPDDVSTGMIDPQVPLHSRSSSIPRCLAVHPSATELAVGDKEGNMKVYNLETMELCSSHSAHNAEILTMHYSPPIMVGDPDEGEQSSRVLLATAGRDRLVHTFDASDQYRHMLTLDNHSASVTAVRFTGDGRRLLTCGGDKTMTLNRVTPNEIQRYASTTVPHGNIYGLAVDATNKFAITSGHDKRIIIWSIANGRNMRAYKVQGATDDVYKTDTDPASTVLAVCSLDKHVRLIDFFSGDVIEDVVGHSESVTAVRFSPDGEYLISVGGDGCIFVWKVAEELLQQMRSRLMEIYSTMERKKQEVGTHQRAPSSNKGPQKAGSDKPLARPKPADGSSWAVPRAAPPAPAQEQTTESVIASKNQWAQRLQSEGPYRIHGLQPGAVEKRQLDFTAESQIGTMALPADHSVPSGTARSTDLLEAQDDVMVGSDDEEDEDDDSVDNRLFKFREKAESPVETVAAAQKTDGEEVASNADTEEYEDDFINDDNPRQERETSGSDVKSSSAAKQLNQWLEAELKSESVLDEAVRTSLAAQDQASEQAQQQDPESPVKGAAILRQSLSSNFFKEQKDGTPKRPKPADEEPKLAPAQARKQQTASAVAEMRARLKAMGLLKSLKQPVKAQEPKVDGDAPKPQEEVLASTDSEQRRGARSWRDVEEGSETTASKQSQSSAAATATAAAAPSPPTVPPAATTRDNQSLMASVEPAAPSSSASPESNRSSPDSSPQPNDAFDDYKAALQDLAAITQRALSAYKGVCEAQAATVARRSVQTRSVASHADDDRQLARQQEAAQEIRQSLSAVHLSLGMILRAPEANLTQTIDTAIGRIQDPSTTPTRPAIAGLDLSGSVAGQDVAAMLEQYSNMLIDMVGQKMHSMSMAFSTNDASIIHMDKDLDHSS